MNMGLDYELDRKKAIMVYIAMIIGRQCRMTRHSVWNQIGEKIEQVFARQNIVMTWDFPEVNPFSNSSGSFISNIDWVASYLEQHTSIAEALVSQEDACSSTQGENVVFLTDPPYYDNIAYADLSDFFYSVMKPILENDFQDVFSTISTPKMDEITALDYRRGGKMKPTNISWIL